MQKEKDLVSIALESNGAFWAFSDKQFNESKKDNVKYVSLGSGLVCPKDNAKKLSEDLDNAIKETKRIAKEKLDNRAKKLKVAKLSKTERIQNRKILINESVSRVNNYLDSLWLVDRAKAVFASKDEDTAKAIDSLITCIAWENDRPEVSEEIAEEVKTIEELKNEIVEIIKE